MWDEKAGSGVTPGAENQLADMEIQGSWQNDLEASAGWQSTVTVVGGGPDEQLPEQSAVAESAAADSGLGAFADAGEEEPSDGDSPDDEMETDDPEDEYVEFTGVVVQAGEPVVLDNGEETLSVITDADVDLGQEVTVRGERTDGRVDADDIVPT
jgi:replication factor A1